jgi:spermidine synthase
MGTLTTRQTWIVAGLFLVSGAVALVYETVWIRLFAISFGNTAQALSAVLSIFLLGLSIGGFLAPRVRALRPEAGLRAYGLIELAVGCYVLLTPGTIRLSQAILAGVYGSGYSVPVSFPVLRVALGAAILLPATILMGATLPLLAGWLSSLSASPDSPGTRRLAAQRTNLLYTLNLAGAAIGALATGFSLLPGLGFQSTLITACGLNILIGLLAVLVSRIPVFQTADPAPSPSIPGRPQTSQATARPTPAAKPQPATIARGLSDSTVLLLALLSGMGFMLHEVAWNRVWSLILGPTASTLTLILAAFLAGLAIGSLLAEQLETSLEYWLLCSQVAGAVLLVWAVFGAGMAPDWMANAVRAASDSPGSLEFSKIWFLACTLLPMSVALGFTFPILLRLDGGSGISIARRVGGVYAWNTIGSIAGSLLTAWVLIPTIGTERTVLLGGWISLASACVIGAALRPAWRWPGLGIVAVATLALLVSPRIWDMSQLTSGAYKYALYHDESSVGRWREGDLVYLREGVSGTVAVRKQAANLVLSIDGKVDASDAGGDLLTEKLLAHLPLLLAGDSSARGAIPSDPNSAKQSSGKKMCLIGLASGVTAGAALLHPLSSLDVLEVSKEVVEAAGFFNPVNGNPLRDPRTRLLVADGRNHLAMTSQTYDVIVSEPSNPWIAGMNSMFTREFFAIAKRRLKPAGLFAQWFHVYNMPQDDLRSLMGAFTDVFPSAILWQLNDGDVLLTGFAEDAAGSKARFSPAPANVRADLAGVGLNDPELLLNQYLMRDQDLARFASGASRNTDDQPVLEFHGQRDIHAQSDVSNIASLLAYSRQLPEPEAVSSLRLHMPFARWMDLASAMERAESFRTAFGYYQRAAHEDSQSNEALAGMDRTARLPEQKDAVRLTLGLPAGPDNLETRTAFAVSKAHDSQIQGGGAAAQRILAVTALSRPQDPSAHFNYGLFCLEQKDSACATREFQAAHAADPRFVPALEALAEASLRIKDYRNAELWSRKILEVDPNHAIARQTLTALTQANPSRKPAPEHAP